MTVKWQKVPGRPAELGMYRLSGNLAELEGPGKRVVRDLEVTRVEGPPTALAVFAAFPDLQRLGVGGIDGMRLDPLAAIGLQSLAISGARNLDLAPLSAFAGLRQLLLSGLEHCRVPDRLALPATLRSLVLLTQTPEGEPDVVAALVRSIDWSALPDLKELDIRADGALLRVDLGILRELPNLERLDLPTGVVHDAAGPSPLEPPFEGLSRKLQWLRIESDDPDRLTSLLNAYLPSPCAAVLPRPDYGDAGAHTDEGEWEIIGPDSQDRASGWQVYGSLADAFEDVSFDDEHEACKLAKARLQTVDPERASRIEFDSEADGTGIYAHSREDLEWALATLGLRHPGP
jgi:hypothetical protein